MDAVCRSESLVPHLQVCKLSLTETAHHWRVNTQTDFEFVAKRVVVSFIFPCLQLTKGRFIRRLASNVHTTCALCTREDGRKWVKNWKGWALLMKGGELYKYIMRCRWRVTSHCIHWNARHQVPLVSDLIVEKIAHHWSKWFFTCSGPVRFLMIYDIWYDIFYDMIWYMIWYEMIWNDMIWYDMIWYDMIWYDWYLQLGSHLVAVVQYTYTHKQYTEQHNENNI